MKQVCVKELEQEKIVKVINILYFKIKRFYFILKDFLLFNLQLGLLKNKEDILWITTNLFVIKIIKENIAKKKFVSPNALKTKEYAVKDNV